MSTPRRPTSTSGCTPRRGSFHATDIPNVPAKNLVQIGIGGWQAPRPGVKVGRERGTTVMTVTDCAVHHRLRVRRSGLHLDLADRVRRSVLRLPVLRRAVGALPDRRGHLPVVTAGVDGPAGLDG